MENKINVAELLKDCPQGMELDCALYDNVFFDGIDTNDDNFPISLYYKHNNIKNGFSVTKYGTYYNHQNAKCVIFPKGKTTWEGFVPPCNFKDGDILATDLGSVFFLNTRLNTDERYGCYVGKGGDGSFHICEPFAYKECCGLATEKEKEKLFKTIKDNGYKWNPETKTLEELVEPRFKVGDRIKAICNNNQYDIKELTDTHYTLEEVNYKFKYTEPISEDKNWELVPNKFDITTLKPFDKVLVRDNDRQEWSISLFSHYNGLKNYKYSCINGNGYAQCIPYEAHKELRGATDDCDNFYKTWE